MHCNAWATALVNDEESKLSFAHQTYENVTFFPTYIPLIAFVTKIA